MYPSQTPSFCLDGLLLGRASDIPDLIAPTLVAAMQCFSEEIPWFLLPALPILDGASTNVGGSTRCPRLSGHACSTHMFCPGQARILNESAGVP